ncbi:hypothetical protein O9649_26190 [Achromobacter dolens]|uniref:hypothetical protein n=1 Tax=Achromobacter dolens TaxID=1287738 RepID=UPI0022B8ADC8|nr:hypothetical protein [Achromobacter dolens]MCZ8411282.1 hypothetical protein [Achromobacter dolens]
MFLPRPRGTGKLWLALLLLLPCAGNATSTSQANVDLTTNLNTLAVQIGQSPPLPAGGCWSGYAWHTTYGGCRRADQQSETAQCPAGYTGSQVRYRTAYILQSNPNDVAYTGWGAWQSSCQVVAPTQAVFTILLRPTGVGCRSTEYKVRANYPDGSVAAGITLNWEVVGLGAIDTNVTTTNGRGEASVFGTYFHNLDLRVKVSFGSSSQEIYGICIGGT